MDIPLLSRMDAVAEYFIDEVETLKALTFGGRRDAVKSRFYGCMRQEIFMCYTIVS